MLRLASIAAAAVLLASPALAYCPAVPDGPYSYNVQNGTQLALCQQGELGLKSDQLKQDSEMKAVLQQLQNQQLQLQQRLLPVAPPLPQGTF